MLRTKINKPIVLKEILERSDLINGLEFNLDKPLTLVSAPAGYGKSVIISNWLEKYSHNYAWVSLDKDDNNFGVFITYLYHAFSNTYPGKFEFIKNYFNSSGIAMAIDAAHEIINQLDEIDAELILVLDDYYFIQNPVIHQFIDELLRLPPENFQLVIITRIDPPINTCDLRAHGRVNEIRMTRLAFDETEIKELFHQVKNIQFDEDKIKDLYDSTEGWATGLKLISLALEQNADTKIGLGKLTPATIWISDFLYQEVFTKQSEEIQNILLHASFFNRFCPELLDAIIEGNTNSHKLILKIRNSNLFTIALDSELKWSRYHHLFHELLVGIRVKIIDARKEKQIRSKAAIWFESKDLILEAVENYVLAEEIENAIRVIDENRHIVFSQGEWVSISQWIEKIPSEIIDSNPILLISKAWIAYSTFTIEAIPPLLEVIETNLKTQPNSFVSNELQFMKGNINYWIGEVELAAQYLDKVKEATQGEYTHLSNNNLNIWALAHHFLGEEEMVTKELLEEVKKCPPSNFTTLGYIYASLGFMSLLSTKLKEVKSYAYLMGKVAIQDSNPNIQAWSEYLLGCTNFHDLNTKQSVNYFTLAGQHKYILDLRAVFDAFSGIALSYGLNGQQEQAEKALKAFQDFKIEVDDPMCTLLFHSCKTRLSLILNEPTESTEWTHTLPEKIDNSSLLFWTDVPEISKLRLLINEGSKKALNEASKLVKILLDVAQKAQFKVHVYDLLVLQSILLFKQEKKEKAVKILIQCMDEAFELEWSRPFVEPGNHILPLLQIISNKGIHEIEIEKVRALINLRFPKQEINGVNGIPFTANQNANTRENNPLTIREVETLVFVEKGLRNKEIAEKMFISVDSIKKNMYRIFQKLEVKNRVELVKLSKELELTKQFQ